MDAKSLESLTIEMLDFNRRPFNYLPLNRGDLFDLSCEYSISLLQKINYNYYSLIEKAKEITQKIPSDLFSVYKECFDLVENIMGNYTLIIKCCKLSLGQNVGRVKGKNIIFHPYSYKPNTALQEIIVHGFRNTAQHFEERLQDYGTQLNPFLMLSYKGQNINWNITFGNGGFKHDGQRNNASENFQSCNLYFQSYKQENNKLIKVVLSIDDVWKDTLELCKLIEENMENMIISTNICCPPVRNFSVFME